MDLGEGRVELVVGDVFGVDLEVFEEGLVEEAALERVGALVGGLDVVGQLECVRGPVQRLICASGGISF